MANFRDDVLTVLDKKNYVKHCYSLEEFLNIVESNKRYTQRKVFWYKWFGFLLLMSIPLISSFLSVLVNTNHNPIWLPECLVIPTSLTLTLFTILNSIFKPSERFQSSCQLGVAIENFIVKFLIELEQKETVDESDLIKLVDKKQKEFECYQIRLISLFMPVGASGSTTGAQGQTP